MTLKSDNTIHIIDLFAGPGGLGEGFSSCENSRFNIGLSVEKDKDAHNTLKLRSFYRKLKNRALYNNYVSSVGKEAKQRAKDRMITAHEREWSEASREVLDEPCALGNGEIFEKWKAGEKPTESDFSKKTAAQKKILQRVKELIELTGRKPGRNVSGSGPLIVIGGPPCQAYSTIGRGRRAGIIDHNPDHDERFFLYKEYAEIINLARPDLFVMENVVGIGSAKLSDGSPIFPKILQRLEYLKEPNLNPSKKVYNLYSLVTKKSDFEDKHGAPAESNFTVRAVEFGVPQHRERVIILGIRADRDNGQLLNNVMNAELAPPTPSVSETISSLPSIRSYISTRKNHHTDSEQDWLRLRSKNLSQIKRLIKGRKGITRAVEDAITWDTRTAKLSRLKEDNERDDFTLDEIDTFQLSVAELVKIESSRGKYQELFANVHPKIEAIINGLETENTASAGNDDFLSTSSRKKNVFSKYRKYSELGAWLESDIPGYLNHNSKKHMPEDLTRYMYCALWTEATKTECSHTQESSSSPITKYFPLCIASNHKSWFTSKFQDRFRAHPSTYRAKTMTAHMHKDGHANIHYDPLQSRSFTVREAARIQTFPDDYYFEGGQSAQFKQVGNAVPPFLAKQIAEYVQSIIDQL